MDININQIDTLLGLESIKATVDVLVAWKKFKAGHDIQELTLRCCDISAELFDTLEHLDALISQAK